MPPTKFAISRQIPYTEGVKANIRIPLAALALTTVAQAAHIVDTFDSGANGWTAVDVAAGVSWSSTGGNPGGHIVIADDQTNWAYFRAPGSYLATPAMYGGALQFDLRHTSSTTPAGYRVRVALQGAGFTLINESTIPTTSWQSYGFTLSETAGWRKFSNLNQNYSTGAPTPTAAEMQSVLGGMTGLFIAADYNDETVPPRDVTYLDNVSLEVVPEPATMTVLGLGAAALLRRRRK